MDHLQTRLDALEQQMRTLEHQTHTIKRQLRWWRGLACALVVLGLVALPLYGARTQAQEEEQEEEEVVTRALTLAQRVAALESKLRFVTRSGRNMFITGANLHLVNGLGETTTTNGLGNLIVGYNESREEIEIDFGPDICTGSHNVVVGRFHDFSRFGGLVVGDFNTISGDFAVVSGGVGNTASGEASSVSGGFDNTASGDFAVVSGGANNTASGEASSVSGGGSIPFSSEPGNTASGNVSSVSGGRNRTAEGEFDWVAGSLVEDQ
jgi:hypothetical protein